MCVSEGELAEGQGGALCEGLLSFSSDFCLGFTVAPGSSKHLPENSSGGVGSGEICHEQPLVGEVATTFCS